MQSHVKHPDRDPIRVLIVSDYAYPAGGIEQFIRQLISALPVHVDCRLLSWSSDILVPTEFEDLTVVECGDIRQAWPLMDWASVLFVPTSFNVRMLTRLTTEYLSRNPKPTVAVVQTSSHSDPSAKSVEIQNEWLAELLNRCTRVVAVSNEVAEAIRDLPLMANSTKQIIVIENAARLSTAHLTSPRVEKRKVVSFIGRPFSQKGFDLYVRLAHDLSQTGLKFVANTVGVPIPKPIKGMTVSTTLSDDELLKFFEQTDVLLVPYLYADGLPLAVLEALNCGVPVIGFDSPGVGHLLRRYAQKVIAPNYSQLRRAVEDWHDGRMSLISPSPGAVPSWADALARYISIIESLGVPTVE